MVYAIPPLPQKQERGKDGAPSSISCGSETPVGSRELKAGN